MNQSEDSREKMSILPNLFNRFNEVSINSKQDLFVMYRQVDSQDFMESKGVSICKCFFRRRINLRKTHF